MSANKIETLKDLLETKSLSYLIRLAALRKIEFPETNTDEEWKMLSEIARGENSEQIEHYLELSYDMDTDDEKVEKDDLDQKDEENEWDQDLQEIDPEIIEAVRKYREQERKLIHSIRRAEDSRNMLAEKTAERLLTADVFRQYLSEADDCVITFLKEASCENRDSDSSDPVYSITPPWNKNYAFDSLEKTGYAVIHNTKPWENPDEHRHITGVTLTPDVLELFCKIYTEDFDLTRRHNKVIRNSCYFSTSYYEVAPLEIAHEIYVRLCRAENILPETDEIKFMKIANKVSNSFYRILEFKKKYYVADEGSIDELERADDPEESIINYRIQALEGNIKKCYIPEVEEINEYLENSFWPSREPYRQLKEWLTMFYLDEKEMENMGNRMFSAFLSEEEADDDYFKQKYSMDNVEENVSEKISFITWLLMMDYTAEEVIEHEEIEILTIPVTDKAKKDFLQILENCALQTNKPNLFGHCEAF